MQAEGIRSRTQSNYCKNTRKTNDTMFPEYIYPGIVYKVKRKTQHTHIHNPESKKMKMLFNFKNDENIIHVNDSHIAIIVFTTKSTQGFI